MQAQESHEKHLAVVVQRACYTGYARDNCQDLSYRLCACEATAVCGRAAWLPERGTAGDTGSGGGGGGCGGSGEGDGGGGSEEEGGKVTPVIALTAEALAGGGPGGKGAVGGGTGAAAKVAGFF